jgi:dTDP-4-dehydrorhamnose 3,5-epimerase
VKFHDTGLEGAFIIDLDRLQDSRGFFARTWCQKEFQDQGLISTIAQANTSFNNRAGTLRGMHYQAEPYQETKLVRCTSGALYDVIIDLRPQSATYRRWFGAELTAENGKMLYVPADFAHGFITLKDNTEVHYLVSELYTPGAERGVRWDDPAFAIEWPQAVEVISEKDAAWPDFADM